MALRKRVFIAQAQRVERAYQVPAVWKRNAAWKTAWVMNECARLRVRRREGRVPVWGEDTPDE